MKKGKTMYVPRSVQDELESIRSEHDLSTKVEAWIKMEKFSKVGREKKVRPFGGRY